MGANYPRGGAIFDPRGLVGRIFKENHYTLLHTKYESSGPCGFREKDFFMSSHDAPGVLPVWTKGLALVVSEKKIFLCFSHDAPGAWPVGTPEARLAGFIKRTTIHYYTQNMTALALVALEKKIFYVLPMTPPGRSL